MNPVKIELLKNVIEQRFDIDLYKKFIREFFNEVEELSGNKRIGIWREYDNYVNSYYTIAKYTDSQSNKVVMMAVELKKDLSIDRARSMQRNFISKVLDENNYDAAIVAFFTDTEPSWRLSFVRLDYTFTDKGLKLDLTPARRYSFLVGENEPNHTVMEQLLPIFEDDKNNPTLDEIENAFSIEKVTSDFFNKYKQKYLDLKEYLEKHESFIKETKRLGFEVDKFSEQFSKKLMGQLAFLYFIQKKGWLGVRILPENKELSISEFEKVYVAQDDIHKTILTKFFRKTQNRTFKLYLKEFNIINDHEAELLSDCFEGTKYDMPWGLGEKKFIRGIIDFCIENTTKNFFNDYLQPLFYEGLNKKRKNHYFKTFNCKIPFLNGGLFEPIEGYHWKDVNFEIPDEIFSNKTDKGRDADGILDIFDHYNFTMNEEEPFEKEVAIDPEMLGKIFENLLDVKDRKSKGAFYTPREIVHYMCQESLINYLTNEVDVTYEDMKEFILYSELIRDSDNRRDVGRYKDLTINQSIFNNIVKIDNALKNVRIADPAVGSGAFPLGMLNEIVRARNNITEYIMKKNKEGYFGRKYDDEYILRGRSPYKIKWDTIKNCIFAVDIEPSAVDIAKLRLWLSIVVDQEIDDENPEPHPLPNLDMNIHMGDSLIDEYEGIKLFDSSILENSKDNESNEIKQEQLRMLFDSDEILRAMYEKESQYFEENDDNKRKELKYQIDALRDQLITHKLQENDDLEALEKYNKIKHSKSRPFFIWELEFSKVFKENGGFDIVIGNPPYAVTFNKKMKRLLGLKYPNVPDYESSDYFICRGHQILKKKGILSYIIPNTILANVFAKKFRKELINNWSFIQIDNLSEIDIFESAKVRNCILILEEKYNNTSFECKFLNAMVKKGNYIVNNGKKFNSEFLLESRDNWLSLFTRDEIITRLIKKINSISKPLSYYAELSQGLIPYDKYRGHSEETIKNRVWHSSFKKDETYKKELQGKDIDRYYLKWNGSNWISYGDWLAAPRKPEYFTDERIIVREITNPMILATYTKEEYYNTPSIINIINFDGIDIKYVLALLNSKMISFYHVNNSPKANKGLFPKILVNDLRNIPIIKADKEIEHNIIKTVEKIMIIKSSANNNIKNNELKRELDTYEKYIDENIYKIYKLDYNDIEIIENYFSSL